MVVVVVVLLTRRGGRAGDFRLLFGFAHDDKLHAEVVVVVNVTLGAFAWPDSTIWPAVCVESVADFK